MNHCPCGNEVAYEDCCHIYHKGEKSPESAEKLMRARYSAFAKNQVEFIGKTHMPGTKDFNEADARGWAEKSIWKELQIVSTKKGGPDDQSGVVEFKAIYSDKDTKEGDEEKGYIHHEISSFKKIDDTWYYEKGQIVGAGPIQRSAPKVGRNEPCPCGSGKKFKKCCGA